MVKKNSRFSQEVRERAVRLVFDSANEYGSQWAAIQSIAVNTGLKLQIFTGAKLQTTAKNF
jgi:transposase